MIETIENCAAKERSNNVRNISLDTVAEVKRNYVVFHGESGSSAFYTCAAFLFRE